MRKIRPKDENTSSFRAEAKLLMPDSVLGDPGGLVKFVIPYCNDNGEYGVVTEKDDDQYDVNHRVYHRKYLPQNSYHSNNDISHYKARSRVYNSRFHIISPINGIISRDLVL